MVAGVVGVLLSGMLNDGSSGLWTIEQLGGHTLVQHPEEAEYPEMPLNALRQVAVDEVLRARDIGPRLDEWLGRPPAEEGLPKMNEERRQRLRAEIRISAGEGTFEEGTRLMGSPSALTCPECHGVLGLIGEEVLIRFRCHTGHAFTAEVLLSRLREETEAALWSAVRVLDEQVILLDQWSGSARPGEDPDAARQATARRLEARGDTLRRFIQRPEAPEEDEPVL